jgi:Family of unknown function (DUF6510)
MQVEEMRLDGNAAAGALREIFAQEMTVAVATCTGCGTAREIGTLLEYGHAMGVVLRCPGCDTAMLRFARTPGWLRLDASGISYLVIPELNA